MHRRITDVTAHTTFDYVEARALGPDWSDDAVAVMDVTPDGEAVSLALELDPDDLDNVDAHADRVRLSPDQARTLAAELRVAADDLESAHDPDREGR